MAKPKRIEEDEDQEEEILGGGSTLSRGETTADDSELQEARQRDTEPDDFDGDPTGDLDIHDDRIRGAGQQSLDDLAINRGLGKGLAEHIGGLRHDRPEPNVNDPDPEEPLNEAV